jgi:molybdopterin/thiamine biosynthesis adenylyltransferase
MDDDLLLRYSRQILLPEIDINGQNQLAESTVVIIGIGGLGSPIAMYLTAAGVGNLVLVDHDIVELSNLQRQIVHSTPDIGKNKVVSAKERLLALNPNVEIKIIPKKLESAEFNELFPSVDAVVDATDNFESRFEINRQCVKHNKPLISGAAIRFEGQVAVFQTSIDSPCYRCLYNDDITTAENCIETGVIAPLLGIIGSIQALETLKVLTRTGTSLDGRLLLLDALGMEWQTMKFKRDPKCPVCANRSQSAT